MSIKEGTIRLKCARVQLMKEHDVMSNIVTLASVDNCHDQVVFEEFAQESAYAVGRDYEVTVRPVTNA